MNRFLTALLLAAFTFSVAAQNNDSIQLRRIYTEALTHGQGYATLDHLCNKIGGRLSGSPQSHQAVGYTAQQMYAFGFDTVYLQAVVVPRWERGEKEKGYFKIGAKGKQQRVRICALGNSVGTPDTGVTAPVIEVQSLKELDQLGEARIKGKIVFFNRPLDPTHIITGRAYGGAGDQRGRGATMAARYGAVGAIVRSLTLALDTNPHTGMTHYFDTLPRIPACAISTVDADILSAALKTADSSQLTFYFRQTCRMQFPDLSYNVIGELRGTTKADEIIVVGGHLDSWDTGQGAHDDGAGVVHSMEAMRILKALGLKPKRTLRCVLFMNEENGVKGGIEFAEQVKKKGEKVIAAIESDAGGFTPRGFGVEDSVAAKALKKWEPIFEPYGIEHIRYGHGGTDIEPLKPGGTIIIGFEPDSQRYFDYHHTAIDTFDKVNKRELELGAASISSLLWLLSEYGVK